jgi:DNA polymerase III sliding clamp (beta) subunit (PCNA family)
MLEGLFTSDYSKRFLSPLNDIIKVGITEKILLNIDNDTIKISACTPTKSNFVILKYKKELFKDFKMPSKPLNFGVKDLGELVSILKTFSDGFDLKIEQEVLTVSSGHSNFTYYSCNEELCIKGPKTVNADEGFFTAFKWSNEMKTFTNAINQLREQEHIVIHGNKGDAITTLMITNDQFKRYNNFTSKVQSTEISQTFRKIIDKNIFHPVVTSSVNEFVVKVFEPAVLFFGNNEDFSIVHSVSTKVK